MVNFRYHLVSLIAVFLALTVGVVLGAGPLQTTIGGGPEEDGQQTEELRAQLDESTQLTEEYEHFTDAVGAELLEGQLDDRSVAFVLLPGATPESVATLSETIQKAGGKVEGRVLLTEAWQSTDSGSYRETLAGPVESHLSESPEDTSASGILAAALVEVLTETGPQAELLKDMFTDAETPMVEATSLPKEPVTDIVLVGAAASETQPMSGDDPARDRAWVGLASALAQMDGVGVAVGPDAGLIGVLRSNRVRIATVDQPDTPMSAINVTLALATGDTGAYGQGDGSSQAVAPLP